MKKIAFGMAAAAVIGLASLVTPAAAAPAASTKVDVSSQMTDFSSQVRRRTTIIRRGPVCSMRTVVKRGPYGRRVVTKTRVCR